MVAEVQQELTTAFPKKDLRYFAQEYHEELESLGFREHEACEYARRFLWSASGTDTGKVWLSSHSKAGNVLWDKTHGTCLVVSDKRKHIFMGAGLSGLVFTSLFIIISLIF